MDTIKKYQGAWLGLMTFIFVNASFALMLLSPWLENPIGRRVDERLLSSLDDRIDQVRKGEVRVKFVDASGAPVPGLEIEYRLIRHEFVFGCNLFEFESFEKPEDNRRYEELFTGLFNTAVLPFYWRNFEPHPGELPKEDLIARMLAWCEAEGINAKGHPLAWRNPAGYPDWLPADQTEVAVLLKNRIQGLVKKHQGRIRIWDLVNEPTHLPPLGHDNVFEYVSNALAWAREADPEAMLVVNDYGILGHDFGGGPYYRLIERLLETGAPLDAIGFQGHEPRTDWIPLIEIEATLNAFARLGLPLQITEITIPSAGLPITNSWKKGVWTEEDQAEYLERFYKLCFSHPAVEGIIYWDLYDGNSWVKTGGLVDENWGKKPAYLRLEKLINHDWITQGKAVTDASGEIRFRGFYGRYEIHIAGRDETYQFQAGVARENNFILALKNPPD